MVFKNRSQIAPKKLLFISNCQTCFPILYFGKQKTVKQIIAKPGFILLYIPGSWLRHNLLCWYNTWHRIYWNNHFTWCHLRWPGARSKILFHVSTYALHETMKTPACRGQKKTSEAEWWLHTLNTLAKYELLKW